MTPEKSDLIVEHISRKGAPFNMAARHYHDQYEIYYLLNGERYYFIDNRTYHIKKGDIVLIDKNILHKTNTTREYPHERILIQFSTDITDKITKDIDLYHCFHLKQNVYSLNPEEQLWMENHLFNILQEKKKKQAGYFTYVTILITELLIFLNRFIKSTTSCSANYPNETHKKISEIAGFINNNFNNKLSLTELAEQFNYSPTYLSKTFKKVTGFSFVEYKNNVRIKEASKLLQQSSLNITEIACQVGYNNLTHFGRIFKNITGHSPLKYRKIKENSRKKIN
ncbi:helix-turn-helix domain-containing protein [Iocasia frigidifontis]|uniref:Helix-turn-helix domain-containing protein n=1 Tax=Iocasia fonsfrigidae TaxID=2682810 RepID=A0A8A7KHE7_9FIRM|nr:AraC family transcriptional regulator [Iocasia fonsfrigidae]QTL97302.1 helix-turn-helix domain-containing protein [Iocasia fonsfrigidae]